MSQDNASDNAPERRDEPDREPGRVVHVPREEAGERRSRDDIGVDTLLRCLIRLTVHYGRPVPAPDIRSAVPIPESGMTPETFARAAGRLGYAVRDVPFDLDAAQEMPVPFVLLGRDGGPCALVLSRSGDELVIFDPIAEQSVRVKPGAATNLADRAILIKPEDSVAPRANWRSMIGQRVKAIAWELVLASVFINLFALASPLFMMTVYNKVIGQRALETLWVLVIAVVTIALFDVLLRAVRGYVSSYTGARLDALIGSEVVHHLVHLPYKHFEQTPTGVITERLRQLDTIRHFFSGQMPITLVDMAFVILFVAALFFISPLIAWLVVGTMPVFLILSVLFHRKQKELIEQDFVAHAAKASALNETVNNALTIKSMGLESDIENRWSQRLALGAWTGFKAHNQTNIINIVGALMQQIVTYGVVVIGVLLILENQLSIGALIAANILASRAIAPVRQVVGAWHQLQEVKAAFNRLDDIMDEQSDSAPGATSPMPPIRGKIDFEKVSFRFADDQPPVLDDVNLAIPQGAIVGIVGPSGSGKSTLVKLLQGLYQPDTGRILIDDTDLAHMSLPTLRQQMGVVPQEIQLFAGSVRDNIAMGLSVKDPMRVVAIARFVGAHDFIQRLPNGYDTVLAERGVGLSSGQRQLIALARALIRNPRLIILDEATSALDLVSEETVMRNLRRVGGDRTIVMVTHRTAPLAICDQVAFMNEGRVEKSGKPADVIPYARDRMNESRRQRQEEGVAQQDNAPPDGSGGR
ncbi:MAG: peptidase domain-containing ABC transporter [Alphaproteobacteria bacterium]|nr:peptidase domain-containing ABC transporter [Alphaproteobacteria bacterium]